jgi:coenzyme F420-reducing hydrogenase delta subunit
VAGCPAQAIEMEGMQIVTQMVKRMNKSAVDKTTSQSTAQLIVFGCTRSAGQAYALTRLTGRTLPKGVEFIEVPCGGTISSQHLLAAFDAGADGVMLCTCHTDNCKSEIGNRMACKRADSARNLLTGAGVESDRLTITSLAANMGNELYTMITAFVDRIEGLSRK